jgi:hypothetical protein
LATTIGDLQLSRVRSAAETAQEDQEELFEDIRARAKDWLAAAARKAEALQLTSLALELEDYLTRMAEAPGTEAVASRVRDAGSEKPAPSSTRRRRNRPAEGTPGTDSTPKPRRGIQIAWDPALRQMGELRAGDDGEILVVLNPDDARIRALRERRDCPGLVHIISAYVAQYAALSEENARRVLRPGIVRAADPGLREHELYAWVLRPRRPAGGGARERVGALVPTAPAPAPPPSRAGAGARARRRPPPASGSTG